MTKKYTPTVKNRASICQWTLTFSFIEKKQCDNFIAEYNKHFEYPDLEYSCEFGDSLNPTKYTVTVSSSWANTLKVVANILQGVDYDDE